MHQRTSFLTVLGVLAVAAGACSNDGSVAVIDPDTGVVDTDAGTPNDLGATDDIPRAPEDVPADVAADVAMGAPCRTTADCTAPDFCTNAQVCRFGRCVVVGGPAQCNDQVQCTNDRCDPMRGGCVHEPDDMRCPSGQFCTPTTGCVQALPCGDDPTVCNRLSGDPCTGTWECNSARRPDLEWRPRRARRRLWQPRPRRR